MPLFDEECENCGEIFEFLKIRSDEEPICPKCKSYKIHRIFTMLPHIRMNSDDILHNLPDPQPPLRELIGKNMPGTTGGFKELENEQRQLKEYIRKKDKYGNNIWIPKERKYFYGNSSYKRVRT